MSTEPNKLNDASTKPFESDTHRIIRRHLENPNDVITDADIASVRVGMIPQDFDRPTAVRFESDSAQDDLEKEYMTDVSCIREDNNTSGDKGSSWNVLES